MFGRAVKRQGTSRQCRMRDGEETLEITHPPPKAIRRYLFNTSQKSYFRLVDPARAVERWSPNLRTVELHSAAGGEPHAQLLEECYGSTRCRQRPLGKKPCCRNSLCVVSWSARFVAPALAGASIIGKEGADVPASAQTLRRRGP